MEPRKWSWTEFILGWLNKKFLVFLVITYFVNKELAVGHADTIKEQLVIGWIIVSVVWMLSGAIEELIKNGKLNVEAKLGAQLQKGLKGDI